MPLLWVYIFFYFVITGLITLLTSPAILHDCSFLTNRCWFLLAFTILYFTRQKINSKPLFVTINIILCYALLTLLYKETAQLHIMPTQKMDGILSNIDYSIFGYQPSIKFSQYLSFSAFNELMFAGYFFYYLTPLAVIILNYKLPIEKLQSFGFILIGSFLLYYTLFILFPAAGPQFYFSYPDNYIEAKGIFGKLIKLIQANGEAPTAAFPSSHVGINVIILIWMYQNNRKYFYYQLPFTGILLFSTVYIKAHYVIDVVAGIITAPMILYINHRIYELLKRKKYRGNNYKTSK